jgi:hypothetical protein
MSKGRIAAGSEFFKIVNKNGIVMGKCKSQEGCEKKMKTSKKKFADCVVVFVPASETSKDVVVPEIRPVTDGVMKIDPSVDNDKIASDFITLPDNKESKVKAFLDSL